MVFCLELLSGWLVYNDMKRESMKITIKPIGIIHSCYTEKFGVPRQPGLVKSATARLELLEPYNRAEMVKGLEAFSHIWIHFLFHETVSEGWKATIRPPFLGGKKRVGIFASRSPHRPNHLGMSVVRLSGIVIQGKKVILELAGIDLLDQTPVVDIKPYVPYSDRIDSATGGFTSSPAIHNVSFNAGAEEFCRKYEQKTGRPLKQLIKETIGHDPRPAAHRATDREYGMLLWDVNVRFVVVNERFFVQGIERI